MTPDLPQDPGAFARRRERLVAKLGATSALFVSGELRARNYPANPLAYRADSHFLYFVGLPQPGAAVVIDRSGTTLFLPPAADDDALWHGPTLDWGQLRGALGVDEVLPLDALPARLKGRTVATFAAADPLARALQEKVLARSLPYPAKDATNAHDMALVAAVIELRLTHDDAAVDGLRRAAAATRDAHLAGMGATRPGVTEAFVRAQMEARLMEQRMTVAYGSIVTVHGEVLHNPYHFRTLKPGDLLLADVGAETPDGWAGDVTRAWPVSGRFSSTQRDVYDVVLAAQKAAIALVRPGRRYRDVHLEAARLLAQGLVGLGLLRGSPDALVERGAHALFFPHGIGHLLGLDVHDMEDLGDLAGYAPGRTRSTQFGLCYLRLDRDLQAGMAVTIEPGLYFVDALLREPRRVSAFADAIDLARVEQFADVRGIRIEDDVLCTHGGPEVLTHAIPKEPGEVEAAVGA